MFDLEVRCSLEHIGAFHRRLLRTRSHSCSRIGVDDVACEIKGQLLEVLRRFGVPDVEQPLAFRSAIGHCSDGGVDSGVVPPGVVAAEVGLSWQGDEVVEDVEPNGMCPGVVDPDELAPAAPPGSFGDRRFEREQRVVGCCGFVFQDATAEDRRPKDLDCAVDEPVERIG